MEQNKHIKSLQQLFEKLLANQQLIQQRLTKIENTIVTKDEQIKQLHTLATSMANDVFKKYAEPLVNDLVTYIHQIERQIEFLKKNKELTNTDVINNLVQTRTDLSEMLKRMNIISYSTHKMAEFKPEIHQPIEIVKTKNKDFDNKIYKSVKSGFYWDNKVKWREQVYIYKYQLEL